MEIFSLEIIFLILLSYSFFWNAILPLFEALTLTYLGNDHHKYSYIRIWGSIGFVVTVFFLGVFFNHYSIEYLPWFTLVLLLGILVSTFFVREKPVQHVEEHSPLWDLIKRPEVFALLMACLLPDPRKCLVGLSSLNSVIGDYNVDIVDFRKMNLQFHKISRLLF